MPSVRIINQQLTSPGNTDTYTVPDTVSSAVVTGFNCCGAGTAWSASLILNGVQAAGLASAASDETYNAENAIVRIGLVPGDEVFVNVSGSNVGVTVTANIG